MVVIQERCEECEELMFGGKCRNPECIKRKRKGSVIWGGKFGIDDPAIYPLGTATTVGEVDSSLTLSSVTVPSGATILTAIAGHRDTMPTISATWMGDAMTAFVNEHDETDLRQVVFGIANASGGTGDIVVSFGGPVVSAVIIASYVTPIDPDPLDDFFAISDVGTVASGPIQIFNVPSMFVCYAANLRPITDTIGSWATSNPTRFTQGQRDGTTGAALSLDATISEAWGIGRGGLDHTAIYTGLTSAEWIGSICTLKRTGSNPGGVP